MNDPCSSEAGESVFLLGRITIDNALKLGAPRHGFPRIAYFLRPCSRPQGVAEVHLGLAGGVDQRDEDIAADPLQAADDLPHGRVAARVALGGDPIEDPFWAPGVARRRGDRTAPRSPSLSLVPG